jgi:hypothetical protein
MSSLSPSQVKAIEDKREAQIEAAKKAPAEQKYTAKQLAERDARVDRAKKEREANKAREAATKKAYEELVITTPKFGDSQRRWGRVPPPPPKKTPYVPPKKPDRPFVGPPKPDNYVTPKPNGPVKAPPPPVKPPPPVTPPPPVPPPTREPFNPVPVPTPMPQPEPMPTPKPVPMPTSSYAKGGKVGGRRGDGIAQRGFTKGRLL